MTRQGFYLDRRFMLLAEDEKAPSKLKNMHIAHYASMCLFQPSVNGNTLRISYQNPQKDNFCADHLDIPLEPENFQNLAPVPVVMHSSATIGYNMGEKYNDWFSQKFGFKVVLAYSGGNTRPVLGNLPGKPANHSPPPKSAIMTAISFIPMLGPLFEGDNERIAFNDCAPYLVISDTSVDDVTSRLPSDVEMDLTKFRGNVVLSGAPTAYSEDFWGELTFGDNGPRIVLTGNCGRCNSLNVDHHTGKSGTGKDGQVLKLLAKDRRVDPGMKYSPIFGRYGFVGKGDEGSVLRVGDEVVVSQKNEERTRFCESSYFYTEAHTSDT